MGSEIVWILQWQLISEKKKCQIDHFKFIATYSAINMTDFFESKILTNYNLLSHFWAEKNVI